MIKNIIFDMGGVLIDWAPIKLINYLNIYDEDAEQLINELFKSYEWIALDAGKMDEEEVFLSVSKRVEKKLWDALDFLIKKWWTLPFIEKEDINDLIEELYNNGYHIYLLSNANKRQAEYFKRLPGYKYFSGRVTSAEIKIIKPDKEIYKYICKKYNLDKSECIFIDDNNTNVYEAIEFGFKACVFNNVNKLRLFLYDNGVEVKVK